VIVLPAGKGLDGHPLPGAGGLITAVPTRRARSRAAPPSGAMRGPSTA